MAVTLYVKVEDVNDLMTDGYTRINLERATAADGAFANVSYTALVADDTQYEIEDSGGSSSSWYRYRFENALATLTSNYSNPFQVSDFALTRKTLRQKAIKQYRAGMVLSAYSSGGDATHISAQDFRIQSTYYSTRRGVGTWFYVASGAQAGTNTLITAADLDSVPALFTVSPALTGALVSGVEVEWHWMVSKPVWDEAINDALRRTWILDRIPIVGNSESEHILNYLPWLKSRTQVVGLWEAGADVTAPERPWGRNTKWWSMRQENAGLTLLTSPAIDDSETVYLEVLRQLDEVFTDDSVIPPDVHPDLLAARAYDAVLTELLRPTVSGAATDKNQWSMEQRKHRLGRLRTLTMWYGPRPRWQDPQLQSRAAVPQPWRAR